MYWYFFPGEREIRDLSKRLKATEHRQNFAPLCALVGR